MKRGTSEMEITSTDLLAFVVRVYNQGYKAGHHDTVEGGYVDIFDCDMTTYHEDVVREIITEANDKLRRSERMGDNVGIKQEFISERERMAMDGALSESPPTPGSALELAMRFHEAYERLAPRFGYETKPETREFDPQTTNGRLMIAVCREIIEQNASVRGGGTPYPARSCSANDGGKE